MQALHFKNIKLIAWALMLLSLPVSSISSFAKSKGEPIIIGENISLQSKILAEERNLSIFLPENYESNNKKFPVLYLLDGPGHYHHTTGITTFLARTGRMPDVIVVAIANTNRTRDFTRIVDTPNGREPPKESGGAGKFIEFFKKELQPFIEKHYRTQPYRILVGHSFGGLFAIDTFLSEPDTFDAYIAISPSLQYNRETHAKKIASRFLKPFSSNKFLYITIADEGHDMQEGVDELREALKANTPKNLRWDYKGMPEETHGSVPHRSTYQGLEILYKPWKPKRINTIEELKAQGGFEGIKQYYKNLESEYGYPMDVPTTILFNLPYIYHREKMHKELEQLVDKNTDIDREIINTAGYTYLQNDDTKTALKYFKLNVERHPNDANLWDSIGDAYKAQKEYRKAAKYYRKAIDIGNDNNDTRISLYKSNLAEVEKLFNK